jgi:hypothetical protein
MLPSRPSRQLHLFRGRRQRGEVPLQASEFQLHCAVVALVRRWIMPGWRFTHIASGEKRDLLTAQRLKRMGVMPGWPDLIFLGPRGEVCFVELKAKGGRLSEAQADIASHLIAAGHGYLCSNSFDDIVATLKAWGVVRAVVSVQ